MKLGCCSGRELKFLGQKEKVPISHGLDVGPEVGSWSCFLIKGTACGSIEGWTTVHSGLRKS